MLSHLRPAIVSMVFFTACSASPIRWPSPGSPRRLFPAQAGGSLVRNGPARSSARNDRPELRQGRRLSASAPLGCRQRLRRRAIQRLQHGPLNEDLPTRIKTDAEAIRAENPGAGHPGRRRDHLGFGPGSGHLAGERPLPGAAHRQGAPAPSRRRSARSSPRTRKAAVRLHRPAARERADRQPRRSTRASRRLKLSRNDHGRSRFREQGRPDPDALLAAAGKRPRPAQGVSRHGAGRRQDLRDAARQGRAASGAWTCWSAWSRPTAAARPKRCCDGLEVMARRPIEHRGRVLMEFDLDAALACKPRLLLVDEYAHSNAPGSRHPKRWQDVEELLDAGIDVWTTLNVQHLESLVDVIWKITGVRQRETVPDSALSRADEIELIDITPSELRQRMARARSMCPRRRGWPRTTSSSREPDGAARAGLAPRGPDRRRPTGRRRCASRASRGPGRRASASWCWSAATPWPSLVRAGRRLSDMMMDAPWTVAHVERPNRRTVPPAAPRGWRGLKLAEQLGGRQCGADRRRSRRHGAGICPPQQRHPDRHRQVASQGLARLLPSLAGGPALLARRERRGAPHHHRATVRAGRNRPSRTEALGPGAAIRRRRGWSWSAAAPWSRIGGSTSPSRTSTSG
jgi:hypothetical protein